MKNKVEEVKKAFYEIMAKYGIPIKIVKNGKMLLKVVHPFYLDLVIDTKEKDNQEIISMDKIEQYIMKLEDDKDVFEFRIKPYEEYVRLSDGNPEGFDKEVVSLVSRYIEELAKESEI